MKNKEEKKKEAIDFCIKNNRLPSQYNSDEKKLYAFIIKYKDTDPEINEIYEKYKRNLRITKKEAIDFCIKNNRLPQRNTSDQYEKSLYYFFLREKDRDPEIKKIYEKYRRRHGIVKKEVIDFCIKNNRLPNNSDPYERRLYYFIISYKDKDPEIKKIYEKYRKKNFTEQIIDFLILHLEDLSILDKSQLLQIAQLQKLPKDLYEDILKYPSGKSKKKKIKDIIDDLKNREDIDKTSKTFDDILDEIVEKSESSVSEEENNFFEELHTGIDTTTASKILNPKKSMETILNSLDALGKFRECEFTGPEAIDYLVKSELLKLWNATIGFKDRSEALKVIEEYMMKRSESEFFRKVINIFLTEYKEVSGLEIPEGYSFPYEPLMMQKLTAYKVMTEHQIINYSETGTGKTNSGVLSARCIDSRITLVVAVNSTINNWTDKAIKVVYPDSKVYLKRDISDTTILDRNFYNFVVVNYEEFQNPDKFLEKWNPFLENNKVDFVILDEVQKVKSSNTKAITNRRKVIENILQVIDLKNGRDLEKEGRVVPVLALSATPVINTLNEGLSILSLLKGIDYTSVRNTRRSALACHFELVKCGLRMTEDLPTTERVITFPIKRNSKDISGVLGSKSFLVSVDRSNCLYKVGECIRRGYLQSGIKTIIYTDLVTDVIDQVSLYLQGLGFKVGEFTGRNEKTRETEKDKFINGNYDILLASEPISTGVNGLQYACGQMIILVSPWTYAEYHQLIGRINRKGTVFSEVKIIIPTIEYINENGDIWSLDNDRLARIKFKQTLADVIMTGEIPDEIITIEEAKRLASERLREFIESGKIDSTKRSEIPVQAENIKLSHKERHRGNRNQRDYFSVYQGFNQRISTSTCGGVFSKIIKSKEDWNKYHDLRNKAMGNIQDQPLQTIARDYLKSKKHKVIGDMGCGMNQLKTLLPENYEVISVDMYAADETVKVCNLMDTSKILPNESLDVAVYCLSLWSKDWREIIKDAYRILDYDGKIIIVEPVSSSSKSIDKVRATLQENGFSNISTTKDADEKFYYMTASK